MTAPAAAEGTCPQIECPRWLNNRINTFALELAMALNSPSLPPLYLSLSTRQISTNAPEVPASMVALVSI